MYRVEEISREFRGSHRLPNNSKDPRRKVPVRLEIGLRPGAEGRGIDRDWRIGHYADSFVTTVK
jgi:hypothetical protein